MWAYRVANTLHWLALATWLGGIIMVAITANVTFKTLRGRRLPDVDIVAGEVVGNTLRVFDYVQLGCAAVLALTLILQLVFWEQPALSGYVRLALLVAMTAVLCYSAFVVTPHIWEERRQWIANERTNPGPHKAEFDRLHKVSETCFKVNNLLLVVFLALAASTLPTRIASPNHPRDAHVKQTQKENAAPTGDEKDQTQQARHP